MKKYQKIKDILSQFARNNRENNPFSACIIYKKKKYYAINKVIESKDPTAHAEIEVIRKVCFLNQTHNLEGAVLISSGEPCGMCLNAIAWAGIKKVYYIEPYKVANDWGFQYDTDAKKLNEFLNLGLKIKQI